MLPCEAVDLGYNFEFEFSVDSIFLWFTLFGVGKFTSRFLCTDNVETAALTKTEPVSNASV